MESVVFLQNIKDLNHILRTLLDVKEFCDEAITVWTMAPAEAHVTAFIKNVVLKSHYQRWRTMHSSPTITSP